MKKVRKSRKKIVLKITIKLTEIDNKKVAWIDCKKKWCEEVGRKINKWW